MANGSPYTADACRNAVYNFTKKIIEKEVVSLTSKAYDNATGWGATSYKVQESPDIPFNKEVIKCLKELGYRIIETSNNHYVFSWEE